MKKVYNFLKLFQWAMIGSLLGRGIWLYLDFRRNPGLYEIRSAPWYTELLFQGAVTAALFLLLGILRLLLKRRMRKDAE